METIKIFAALIILFCASFFCAAEVEYLSGSYANVRQTFINESESQLQNPSHHMTEGVLFDQSKISNTSFGVYLQSGAVNYYTVFDYIPVPKRLIDATTENVIDRAYRGKIILFGEEYYVREVAYPGYISAYKGIILDNVGNSSFTYYGGYGFRTDNKEYDCDDVTCWPAGANITVRKPGGEILGNITVKNNADATIDNLIISVNNVSYVPSENPNDTISSLIIYNTSTESILENGYPLRLKGSVKTNWVVSIYAQKQPFNAGMDIAEYANIAPDQYLLTNATIRYTTTATLNMSTVLTLPEAYKVISNGTSLEVVEIDSTTTSTTSTTTTNSTTTTQAECSLTGNEPPCYEVSLAEVISLINAWAEGTANLGDVIALINAWAAVG
jgi:hypothetical protein